MIDIHAHFAEEGYDFPAEWEKIQAAGVKAVVLAGDNVVHSRMHRDFANVHDGAFFTVGIHPESAGKIFFEGMKEELKALALEKKCVAVGEIGLDYHYEGYDKSAQRALFIAQIRLAAELGLPLQIHSRDACADTISILREFKDFLTRGFLMHCDSYGQESLEAFLKLGAYFSFGGVVCFKNARRAVEAVGACPQERLLSETDSPYLSPFRGQKNTPANIPVIVKKLAEIKGVPFAAMQGALRDNAKRLFPKITI